MTLSRRFWISLLVLLLLLGLVLLTQRTAIARGLEDMTGETDFSQQLAALFWTALQRPVETADMVPVRYAGFYPYGVNTFFEQEVEESKLRRSMEMLRAIGVRWIRQQMPWDRLEIPSKGRYESPYGGSTWESYDRFINLAGQSGLKIVARLDLPPEWARKEGAIPQAPPQRLEDYGDFVYTFVSRYKGKIQYYQIWNEPNLFSEWGEPVDARKYAQLLKIGYTRAKAADPSVVILSAPLAQTLGTPDGLNESDLTYLQKLYDEGVKDYFDILSTQGHGLWKGPGNRRADESQTNFSRLQLIREIMVRNGDANKAIWVSELGWDALPPDFPLPATHGRVTEDQQARYTVAAYRRAQEEWPWVGVMFYWHFRRVHEVNRREVDFYYRMVDPDFTTHPVYDAYGEMTAQAPVLYRGYHQEDQWTLLYRGPWEEKTNGEAVLGRYRESSEPGASLNFRFKGAELSLVSQLAPGNGKLYVEIDGASNKADRLPLDAAGRAYVDLSSASERWQVVIPIASRLPQGEHSVRFTVGASGNPVVVDGLIVEDNPANSLSRVLFPGALLGAALSFLLLVRRGPAPAIG